MISELGAPEEVQRIASCAVRVLASNPSPMTLNGTNTYVLAAEGQGVVVDPGPAQRAHLDAIIAGADLLNVSIATIVTTHSHPDHTAAVPALAARTGAEVVTAAELAGLGGAFRRAAGLQPASSTETITGTSPSLSTPYQTACCPSAGDPGRPHSIKGVVAIPTPGHSADSICLLEPGEGLLLTGDTILGRGTTVIAHPDGHLADYLASLDRIEELFSAGRARRLLPGHGPEVADPLQWLRYYRDHRHERLAEVRAAVERYGPSVELVTAAVYPDTTGQIRTAARMIVRAQLEYLLKEPE